MLFEQHENAWEKMQHAGKIGEHLSNILENKEETQKASNKLDETRRNKNEKTAELRGI